MRVSPAVNSLVITAPSPPSPIQNSGRGHSARVWLDLGLGIGRSNSARTRVSDLETISWNVVESVRAWTAKPSHVESLDSRRGQVRNRNAVTGSIEVDLARKRYGRR
jgi:hypothetical protein